MKNIEIKSDGIRKNFIRLHLQFFNKYRLKNYKKIMKNI